MKSRTKIMMKLDFHPRLSAAGLRATFEGHAEPSKEGRAGNEPRTTPDQR
jgi:hypothetical protein